MLAPSRRISLFGVLGHTVLAAVLGLVGCGVPTDLGPAAAPAFSPMTVRPVLINAPEVQEVLQREYPAVLREAGVGGAPIVWLHIGTTGTVDATRIHQSSGFEALDQAAQNVARAMLFSPAWNDDQVVAVWVQVPIRFAVVN